MKQRLAQAIRKAISMLKEKDGCLLGCPIEDVHEDNPRKLHEVCINHKLANYLEEFIMPLLSKYNGEFFVDIEFNREGGNFKELKIENRLEVVRPDIIIHNRKTECQKNNFLVVECKKSGAKKNELDADMAKLKAFIRDDKYRYKFGLQVKYGGSKIKGMLLYSTQEGIKRKTITV
jgi:hypothetical protein